MFFPYTVDGVSSRRYVILCDLDRDGQPTKRVDIDIDVSRPPSVPGASEEERMKRSCRPRSCRFISGTSSHPSSPPS